MLSKAVLVVLMILSSSLATSSTIQTYSIRDKEYAADKISVQTAVELAYNSYLLACMQSSPKSKNGNLKNCVEKSRNYVKENVVGVLDQN